MLDSAIIEALVDRLKDRSHSESAATFPTDRAAVEYPGLYSWWADDEALSMLSTLFGVQMPPLIYAGQAGATSTRSRRTRSATASLEDLFKPFKRKRRFVHVPQNAYRGASR